MKIKKIIYLFLTIIIFIVILFHESINNYNDNIFIEKWHKRFSEKLSPLELKNKYSAITYHKLSSPPYTEWCYISNSKLIPFIFSPNHDNVIYKDNYGNILAFRKGNKLNTPIWWHAVLDVAEQIHQQDKSVTVHQIITKQMIDMDFKVYMPPKEANDQ